MDHSRWRKQIGMIDDHDECECVNVSSGTGSPGLSGQNPKSRKMVVCVCFWYQFNQDVLEKGG